MLARFDAGATSAGFAARGDAAALASRGPLTPDHVLRKRVALIVGDDPDADMDRYARAYASTSPVADGTMRARPAPDGRWRAAARLPSVARSRIPPRAISLPTIPAIGAPSCSAGGPRWPGTTSDVEYWELEQAKLARASAPASRRHVVPDRRRQ
jgi:hypothetical protein